MVELLIKYRADVSAMDGDVRTSDEKAFRMEEVEYIRQNISSDISFDVFDYIRC